MRPIRITTLALAAICVSSPALADVTLFAGTTLTPTNRTAAGAAIGVSLLVVGFEFEYSSTSEAQDEAAPSLTTGMANVFVQTPIPIARIQPYLTVGAGGYRERLGTDTETNVGMNTGGGVKIALVGPVRARIDYRVMTLAGSPLHSRTQRLYLGLNVRF